MLTFFFHELYLNHRSTEFECNGLAKKGNPSMRLVVGEGEFRCDVPVIIREIRKWTENLDRSSIINEFGIYPKIQENK